MDIIMIRHGETDDNVKKIYGRKNTALNKRGLGQVKDLKKTVEAFKEKKIYISPLERTVETASILELHGDLAGNIGEIDFGIFEGKTYQEIERDHPRATQAWVEDYMNYEIPKGESLKAVYLRLIGFIEERLKEQEDIVLVSHEGVIRLLFSWVFDDPNLFFKFKIDNASVNRITIKDGYKYISLLNYKP